MQKVYLLLRNNEQCGPFTLEELAQQDLRPNDLIWIEGQSNAWLYPTEVGPLMEYLAGRDEAGKERKEQRNTTPSPRTQEERPSAKKSTAKNIFVSLPGQAKRSSIEAPETARNEEWERNAEALRTRATLREEEKKDGPADGNKQTVYAPSYYAGTFNEEPALPKRKKRIAIAAVAVLLIAGAYFGTRSLWKTDSRETVLTIQNAPQTNAAAPMPNASQPPAGDNAEPEKRELNLDLPLPSEQSSGLLLPQPALQTTDEPRQLAYRSPDENKSDVIKTAAITTVAEENTTTTEPVAESETNVERTNRLETPAATEANPVIEVKAKPVRIPLVTERNDKSKERTAVRVGSASLASSVQITASAVYNNGAPGVRGMRVSLYNGNNEWVENAAIEVMYYNGQGRVIETKVVNFSNVAPKAWKTIRGPDHQQADYAYFKLLSVSGKESDE